MSKHIFNRKEAALAYAKGTERILGADEGFINNNQEMVPILVSLLFQSIEISLKHLGIESGLMSERESFDKKRTKNGHGVKEIADIINTGLGVDRDFPVLLAFSAGLHNIQAFNILRVMIFSSKFDSTRESYASRNLGYAQINTDELSLVSGIIIPDGL